MKRRVFAEFSAFEKSGLCPEDHIKKQQRMMLRFTQHVTRRTNQAIWTTPRFLPSQIALKQPKIAVTCRSGLVRPIHSSRVVRSEETEGIVKEAVTNPNATAHVNSETASGESQTLEFQAETRKLLDIVAKSLYTDKEVFVRELVSNASDALEKARQLQNSGQTLTDPEVPFEIKLYADRSNLTLTIQDTGIGMTKEELIGNLGNIGHSGSLDFVQKMKTEGKSADEIIGQFGVGFYSVFMVSDDVTVFSKSATEGSKGYCWRSDGTGRYSISEAEGVTRGTKIILKLNNNNTEFAIRDGIERILKKYSNFVGFPIHLNTKQINTVKPLWTMSKNEISEEDHKQFYRFISGSFDSPLMYLHYSTDSPVNLRSLFYIGEHHTEKFGMGRMEPNISLYCRKVLIKNKAKLLPDWLRFISGVVDSEDLPLNLSREHFQDSALIKRLGLVCTRRIIKFLHEQMKKDPAQFKKFQMEYGNFLKEGLCSDPTHKEELCKIVQFESNTQPEKEPVTLVGEKRAYRQRITIIDYVERMKEKQEDIYYLCAPNRKMAEQSPYIESFREAGVEVMLCYSDLDEIVMSQLYDLRGKKLVSISSTQAADSLSRMTEGEKPKREEEASDKEFTNWMSDVLVGKASSVKVSHRLSGSPAMIVDHGSLAYRKMMKMVNPEQVNNEPQKYELEINITHPLIQKLNSIRGTDPSLAKMVSEQASKMDSKYIYRYLPSYVLCSNTSS
ncbi:heat shock protein Hsp90 family protein [Planoprotostelium fungivorum]|uniref:Heat shock protein Hsp90 family protein n=1 Tax=Planoprotostelium fungivorum TaxID=1890364 RepID=A0A2P6NVS9_9EUKA|nr:heat shock protein Hsp90 family protein [Planoprotostelium fungivorum]